MRNTETFPTSTMLAAFLLLTTSLAMASAAIHWGACSPSQIPSIPHFGPGLQCAELSVPLDWTDTHGQNITVGLTRLQAKDHANSIGSLVFSPGGPGAPASNLVAEQSVGASLFPESITAVFDLVGLDVRGSGSIGTPITCDPQVYNQRTSYFPTCEDECNDIVSANRAAWDNCAQLTGPLLYNLDSRSVARDLEALRVALNEGPLNFLGISYSTIATQTYAQMYPHNFRAITMDAVLNHNASATAQFFDEAQAFENSLHRFADWCNSTNTTVCPLVGQDVLAIYNKTVTAAFASPLPAPGCDGTTIGMGGCFSNITGPEIIAATQDLLLYKLPRAPFTAGWTGLARALHEATQGNGTLFAQDYAGSNFASSNTSGVFVTNAIPCTDTRSDLTSYSDIEYRLSLGSQVAPITRGLSFKWRQQVHCLGFPRKPINPQDNMDVNNTIPLLITQSKWDPNAAYLWAEESRKVIRNNTLVLREGDGHTNSFTGGKTAEITWEYFITGRIPQQNVIVPT